MHHVFKVLHTNITNISDMPYVMSNASLGHNQPKQANIAEIPYLHILGNISRIMNAKFPLPAKCIKQKKL